MDNVKTDSYYIEKIRKDLEFIVKHMRNVDIEELNANEVLLKHHYHIVILNLYCANRIIGDTYENKGNIKRGRQSHFI